MRKPFKKSIHSVPVEEAHGGQGKRQVLLGDGDDLSKHLKAMTKGFLAPGAIFDWHDHHLVDEFFLVLSGRGIIQYRDGTEFSLEPGGLIYSPADAPHRIENQGDSVMEFFFIRIDA